MAFKREAGTGSSFLTCEVLGVERILMVVAFQVERVRATLWPLPDLQITAVPAPTNFDWI